MKYEQKAIFAIRLGKLRDDKKMSQEQLAVALGIDRGTIAKYETKNRNPSYGHLTQFAKYFNVSTDYLLGLSDADTNDVELSAICNYTGLSKESVLFLHKLKEDNNMIYSQKGVDIISTVMESLSNTIK